MIHPHPQTAFEQWMVEHICEIERKLAHMATREDLDAGIAALLTAEAARDAAVTTALNDLIAKVNSGTVAPEDFSAELANIATLQTNAAALTQTATSDDPGPTTVPTTPITPTPSATS